MTSGSTISERGCREPFGQCGGDPGEIVRNRVDDVDPHPRHHPRKRLAVPPGLAEDPTQLAFADHEVVGPFDVDRRGGSQGFERIRHGQTDPEPQELHAGDGLRPE